MHLLWLTENYPPRRGGMAQACDRIVHNLRRAGLSVDVAFFSCAASELRQTERQNGREIVVPVGE
ncbi:MAG: glycogen synthase, partial [Candidatus Riflebacteria bacterium]|nr:glycogen synthase [Candidatus Riflebacteria bacterium]